MAVRTADRRRRKTSLKTISYSTSTPAQFVELPRDGHAWGILCRLKGTMTLAGGSASGTVITTPINPAGMISKLEVETTPGNFAAQKTDIPVQLLHMLAFKLLKKTPRRTAITSGAAAAYSFELEFVIPFSLLDSPANRKSLFQLYGRSSAKVTVTWNSSDANSRDALLSGCDRTATFTNARVECTLIDFLGDDVVKPAFEVAFKYFKLTHASTGNNEADLPLGDGEYLRSIMGLSVDNSARSDSFITDYRTKVGPDDVTDQKLAETQGDNQADYQIPTADWPTGLFFHDFDNDPYGEPLGDVVAVTGSRKAKLRATASAAPTGVSYTECVLEVVALTQRGLGLLN